MTPAWHSPAVIRPSEGNAAPPVPGPSAGGWSLPITSSSPGVKEVEEVSPHRAATGHHSLDSCLIKLREGASWWSTSTFGTSLRPLSKVLPHHPAQWLWASALRSVPVCSPIKEAQGAPQSILKIKQDKAQERPPSSSGWPICKLLSPRSPGSSFCHRTSPHWRPSYSVYLSGISLLGSGHAESLSVLSGF